jgi:hypothetical protein
MLFKASVKYKGVWPVKIYILKLFFALMFLFVAKDAWTVLITHKGDWNPEIAVAWCAMAAYSTLSILGVFHTLKMLPIMLFMFMYKGLWLLFVAYPLWTEDRLAGSEASGWAQVFIIVLIPVLFTPWNYVFKTYILGSDTFPKKD